MTLQGDALRSLFRFDGIITALSGALMLAIPSLLIDLLQLGSLSTGIVRLFGVIWLAFGLWLLTLWNANYTKATALIAAAILAINGDILFLGALFGRLGLGPLGWIAMLGTAVFIFYVAWNWWKLRGRLA